MASEYSLFLTETLYSIPEVLAPTSLAISNNESADVLNSKPETSADVVQIAQNLQESDQETDDFGSLGYQLSKSESCRTILITSVAPEQFRDIPEFGFLPKMLKAVGEDAEKVCYLNLAPDKSEVSELQLTQNYKFALIFLSSEHPFAKRLKLDGYQPKDFKGMKTVLADELHQVESDKQNKHSLWGALQNMYLNK